MEAAGAYIRAVRDAQNLSRADVHQMSGVHESQIARIEAGKQDTGYTSFFAVVAAIRANISDIQQLMMNKRATTEDAVALARRLFRSSGAYDPELDAVIVEELDRTTRDGHARERLQIARMADRFMDRPDLLEAWLDYGEYLLDKH